MKEIVDAFYSGVSHIKIGKMAKQLVKQQDAKNITISFYNKRIKVLEDSYVVYIQQPK